MNARQYKQFFKKIVEKSALQTQDKDELSESRRNASVLCTVHKGETDNTNEALSEDERLNSLLREESDCNYEERDDNSKHKLRNEKRKFSDLEISPNSSNPMEESEYCDVDDSMSPSSRTNFVQYLVPVSLSKVQTEQYCLSLYSNGGILCSSLNHDTRDLFDILVSVRKCCDHPYLVDRSLGLSLIKGTTQLETLDEEIKLSSKLILLYKILEEIKRRGLRVLILYLALGGSGPISTGDILDDIIHEKFGRDSFIRLGDGVSRAKSRDALNAFNDKGSDKFVCLMETHACHPSIKLASIDTVVFFNSDLDPLDDLRALQKVNLDSPFDPVKIFRLYSPHTVEEKTLILAKQGMALEGNKKHVRCAYREMLGWDAPYLFKKLEEFHKMDASDYESCVEDVFIELSSLLPNSTVNSLSRQNSLIVQVQYFGRTCTGDYSLLGEVESLTMKNWPQEPTHIFWKNLFSGRDTLLKLSSSHSSRNRRSPQEFDYFVGEDVPARNKFRDIFERTKDKMWKWNEDKRKLRERRGRKARVLLSNIQNISNQAESIAVQTREHATIPNELVLTEPSSAVPSAEDDHVPSSTADLQHDFGGCIEERPSSSTADLGNLLPLETFWTPAEAPACSILLKELERVRTQKDESTKIHEEMKMKTMLACEEEIDLVGKKYDMLKQHTQTRFLEEKEVLKTKYNKVIAQKLLADAMVEKGRSEPVILIQGLPFSSLHHGFNRTSRSSQSSTSFSLSRNPVTSPETPSYVYAECPPQAGLYNEQVTPLPASAIQGRIDGLLMQMSHCSTIDQLTRPAGTMPQLSTVINQMGHQIRAPAPHLGYARPYLPMTTHRYSSPGTVFSPVSFRPMHTHR